MKIINNIVSILCIAAMLPGICRAEYVAELFSKEGKVEVRESERDKWEDTEIGNKLSTTNLLRTAKASRAGIQFRNGTFIRLNEQAVIDFSVIGSKQNVGVLSGISYFFVRKPENALQVTTPTVTAAIRGTEFVVNVKNGETIISVINGAVDCRNEFGQVTATAMEEVIVDKGKAPFKRVLVEPKDAVQWALYYPEVSDRDAQSLINDIIQANHNDAEKKAKNSTSNSPWMLLAKSYLAQSKLDLDSAKQYLIEADRLNPNSPLLLARLAEIELGFGHIEEGDIYASKARAQSPNDSYVLSVNGFISLAKQNADEAKKYFSSAISEDNGNGLCHLGMGLSLIRQGDLEGGIKEIERAVLLEPNNSLYRSYLGKGYFELEQNNLADEEYNHAVVLDKNDPTPHLYRSFLRLSENDPISALDSVERSIFLNDSRAVYRSSLLLDQDQSVRSASLAQVFTRLGFFDAARVEAIKSVNKDYSQSSGHLLLSEINGGLGLQQAKLSESLLARLLSPVNYNSILPNFTSDSSLNEYTALFDRPTSRAQLESSVRSEFDELSLAARHIHNEENIGYGISYNRILSRGLEDDALDYKDLVTVSTHLAPNYKNNIILDGSFEQKDVEVSDSSASAESKLAGVSLGHHFRISPAIHIVSQLRYDDIEKDALNTKDKRPRAVGIISPEDPAKLRELGSFTSSGDSSNDYLGGRFDTQLIYDSSLVSLVLGGGILDATVEREESAVVLESEFAKSSLEANRPPRLMPPPKPTSPPTPNLEGLSVESTGNADERSQRLFMYSTWHAGKLADLDVGVGYTNLEITNAKESPPFVEGSESDDRLLPKVGVTGYIDSSTTVRAAFYESLGVAGSADITRIEPSLVGGFNQLFDDRPGAFIRAKGAALDHKVAASTYIGTEYFERDTIEKHSSVVTAVESSFAGSEIVDELLSPVGSREEGNEDVVHSYLYQILSNQFAGIVEHAFIQSTSSVIADEFRGDKVSILQSTSDFDTNRVKFGLNFYNRSGWFALSELQWRHQSESSDAIDSFWVCNLGVGYQFSHRRGAVQLRASNIFSQNFDYTKLSDERYLAQDPVLFFGLNYNF